MPNANAYTRPAIPVRLTFAALHAAWVQARRGKRPSANQLAFASRWLDALQHLHQRLRAGTWLPHRTVSFVVQHPKTREIHAPDFADRVLHHWLVARLEPIFERVFIHDSYANRAGKGSHAAVDRLQAFMRQRNGQGWFLQLDVHNFFNSIHRPTLYALLKTRIGKNTVAPGKPYGPLAAKPQHPAPWPVQHAMALQSLCHKLLAQPVQEWCADRVAAAQVPAHKRLCNAAAACGLPIGNLTSQFFANVYLNELDQYVKHTLKVRHYVRYVDDFVLLSHSRDELQQWHLQIDRFLRERLHLRLKDQHRLAPLGQGVDFLGYVHPNHRLVRRRVVAHCKDKLMQWAQRHVSERHGNPRVPNQGTAALHIHASAADLGHLQHLLASYWGHFSHANSVRLRHALVQRFAWLRALFAINPAAELTPRWVLQGETLARQVEWLRQQWPHAVCEVQKGMETLRFGPLVAADGSRVCAMQTGWLRHGTRRREIERWVIPGRRV